MKIKEWTNTDPLVLTPFPNGGWTISQVNYREPGRRDDPLGAYGSLNAALDALRVPEETPPLPSVGRHNGTEELIRSWRARANTTGNKLELDTLRQCAEQLEVVLSVTPVAELSQREELDSVVKSIWRFHARLLEKAGELERVLDGTDPWNVLRDVSAELSDLMRAMGYEQ